ncbi:hypothetical protein NPIL_405911 [Nephila pilipes]|uniref:Uncharacterized protein n=1 Tax=Nephila pilipes TaxID=299642 RepID=A0A8X6PTI9_NEPPI|nr:hypothetical protein NPIL_405911 [Nephila pilipes]
MSHNRGCSNQSIILWALLPGDNNAGRQILQHQWLPDIKSLSHLLLLDHCMLLRSFTDFCLVSGSLEAHPQLIVPDLLKSTRPDESLENGYNVSCGNLRHHFLGHLLGCLMLVDGSASYILGSDIKSFRLLSAWITACSTSTMTHLAPCLSDLSFKCLASIVRIFSSDHRPVQSLSAFRFLLSSPAFLLYQLEICSSKFLLLHSGPIIDI